MYKYSSTSFVRNRFLWGKVWGCHIKGCMRERKEDHDSIYPPFLTTNTSPCGHVRICIFDTSQFFRKVSMRMKDRRYVDSSTEYTNENTFDENGTKKNGFPKNPFLSMVLEHQKVNPLKWRKWSHKKEENTNKKGKKSILSLFNKKRTDQVRIKSIYLLYCIPTLKGK